MNQESIKEKLRKINRLEKEVRNLRIAVAAEATGNVDILQDMYDVINIVAQLKEQVEYLKFMPKSYDIYFEICELMNETRRREREIQEYERQLGI